MKLGNVYPIMVHRVGVYAEIDLQHLLGLLCTYFV